MTANAERSTPHSHFDERVEELAVLVEGEAVRHPRDVVADHPVRAFALDPLIVVRRELERLPPQKTPKGGHNAPPPFCPSHQQGEGVTISGKEDPSHPDT